MVEKEAFITALLPLCDTVCEYDRNRGKLCVRKTDLAQAEESRWYTAEELRDLFRSGGGVAAERGGWVRYLSSGNLRSFFYGSESNESFRLRFRQGGVGYRQYDIRIDRINDSALVISGRDTQEQELDTLTGALSRNHYQREMCSEVYNGGVAILDMDDLKLYNDIYGHSVGDSALRVLADTVREVVGGSGSLVRYGGDEYLLLMPGVTQEAFGEVLGKLQQRLRSATVPGCESGQHPAVSIGCVIARQETIAEAVKRADRLMYRAKRTKDTVITEDTPVENEDRDKPVVLLDMIMPVMDGLQVLEEMNDRGYIEDIPVIMITADDSEEKIRQAYDLGVVDYIARPFDVRVVQRRVQNTVKLYARQRRLAAVMSQQMRRQERTMTIVADILSRVMGYRNGEGADHGRHVEQITGRLLQRLLERTDRHHLSRQDCRRAAVAAMFHDIGKIGVPDELLRKPGILTPEEFEVVKQHTLIGEELLRGMRDFRGEPLVETAAEICRWHHERLDGKGYPDGLKGDEIPVTVQAVSLADAYDALVSQWSYKPAYSHGEALDLIRRGACGAFSTLLVECLQDIQPMLCREIYGMQA